MCKIVQWFVEESELGPVSNYRCWSKKDKHSRSIFGHYTIENLYSHNFLTGLDNPGQTVYKIVGRDNFNDLDINIFPFYIRNVDDQIFKDPNLWPLTNLPESVIDFLRNSPSCHITFLDVFEAKEVRDEKVCSIESLKVQRSYLNLNNDIFWINNELNLDQKQDYYTPSWFKMIGCPFWLNFTYTADYVLSKTKTKYNYFDKQLTVPTFSQGRILFYGGRYRPSRSLLYSSLKSNVPAQHLWASLSGISNGSLSPNDAEEYITLESRWHENFNFYKNFFPVILKTLNDCPINTFPPQLRECNQSYEHLQFFHHANPNHYQNIFIDFSPETFADHYGRFGNNIFITEKILKPIAFCRPFVTLSNPGFYNTLRRLGFRTFDRWWSEDFDSSDDVIQKIREISTIAKMVSEWSDTRCKEVFSEMAETLMHNRRVLEDYTKNKHIMWAEALLYYCSKNDL